MLTRAMALSALLTLGCDTQSDTPSDTPSPSRAPTAPTASAAKPAPASLLTPKRLKEALDKLLGPLPKTARILSLTVLHRQVILQVQDPAKRSQVLEYRYRASGKLEPAKVVTLLGTGKLKDNLFPRQAAAPFVAIKVLEQVSNDSETKELSLKKLVMLRNLPRSRDIQFRVFFKGPKADLMARADKRGRLLGPPKPVSSAKSAR